MDSTDQLFTVLVSEKEHADQQIRSYMDLLTKVTGVVFTALAVAVGWIFADRDTALSAAERITAVLAVLFIAEFSILYGSFSYGAMLNSIVYKDHIIDQLDEILEEKKLPRGTRLFRHSPARRPINFAAAVFNVFQIFGCMVLVYVAWRMSSGAPQLRPYIVAATIILLLAVISQVLMANAIRKVFPTHTPTKPPSVTGKPVPRSAASHEEHT